MDASLCSRKRYGHSVPAHGSGPQDEMMVREYSSQVLKRVRNQEILAHILVTYSQLNSWYSAQDQSISEPSPWSEPHGLTHLFVL